MSGAPTVLILGDQLLALQCAEELRERGLSVVAIASHRESIREECQARGICAIRLGEHSLTRTLAGFDFDYLLSVAFLQMIPTAVFSRARRAAINFHDGPLPRYAGLNTPTWAILQGATEYGVTWHAVTARADAGSLFAQRTFPIAEDETAFSLNTKCYEAGLDSFRDLADTMTQHGPQGRPQELSARTYFSRKQKPRGAGYLDPLAEVAWERTVRALDFGKRFPNPLCAPKIRISGQWIVVRSATPVGADSQDSSDSHAAAPASPGLIRHADESTLTVATAASGDVVLGGCETLCGAPLKPADIARLGESNASSSTALVVDQLSSEDVATVERCASDLTKFEDYWVRQWERVSTEESAAPERTTESDAAWQSAEIAVDSLEQPRAIAALAATAMRLSDRDTVTVAYQTASHRQLAYESQETVADWVPICCDATSPSNDAMTNGSLADWEAEVERCHAAALQNVSFPWDLLGRHPQIRYQAVPWCLIHGRNRGRTVASVRSVERNRHVVGIDHDDGREDSDLVERRATACVVRQEST